jgi:hypothetical protein
MTLSVVSLALIGWIPMSACLFMFFRPVRALTLAYLIGWLLLPVDTIAFKGFWNIDKVLATNFGVLLGTVCFCPGRLRTLRLGVPEYILLAHAAGAFVTSITNQLGVYNGASSFMYRLFYTAVPFWLGRSFIRSRAELLDVARMVVYAASMYALLAIWEWRMSPQIHTTLYGYFQHSFSQHMRWGFFRPIVCFQHALGLGTFFAWTSLLAIAMDRAGELRRFMGVPPAVYVALPVLALLASMSFSPWGLFLLGLGLYVSRARQRWRWTLWAPLFFVVGWMGGRYTGALDGAWMEAAVQKVSEKRAESLNTRLTAETLTLSHAAERTGFGWGGFGRARVVDKRGKEVVTDGLWIILVATYGSFGLISFYLWWCWPIVMTRRAGPWLAADPIVFPILIAVTMQAMNLIFNGFLSPILTVVAGGVVTAMYASRQAVYARQHAAGACPAGIREPGPQGAI